MTIKTGMICSHKIPVSTEQIIVLDFLEGEQGATWVSESGGKSGYTLGQGFWFNGGMGMYGHRLQIPTSIQGQGTIKNVKIWGYLPSSSSALGIQVLSTDNMLRYTNNNTSIAAIYTGASNVESNLGGTFPMDLEMDINIDYSNQEYTGTVGSTPYTLQTSYSLDFWKTAWENGNFVIHVSSWRANANIYIKKVSITIE